MPHGDVGSTKLWLMLLLGVYHGLNPGMGWLFAVALGMQQQRASAVGRALAPMAIGHAVAVGGAVLVVTLIGRALPLTAIRYLVATLLIGLGVHRLVRHRHPRWVRMRVGFRDLVLWSFLMASAHGAGVMVLPVLLAGSSSDASHDMAAHGHVVAANPLAGVVITAVHTVGYLAAMGGIAWVVYRKAGLALLRTAWFNLDVAWAAALVITGLITLIA